MSTERALSVFELAQIFAEQSLSALTEAMIARGYDGVCLPDIRLCWACSDGAHTVQALAKKLGVTKQFCAREVAKLRDEGYLDVTPDPEDARALQVRLSPAGARLLAAIQTEKKRVEKSIAGRIGARKMAELQTILKKLGEAKPWGSPPTPPRSSAARGRPRRARA